MLFMKPLSILLPIVTGGLVHKRVSAVAVNNNPSPRCTLVGLVINQQHALPEPFKCDGQAHDTCRGLYTTMQVRHSTNAEGAYISPILTLAISPVTLA